MRQIAEFVAVLACGLFTAATVYMIRWHGVRRVAHCDTERDDWEHAPAVWKHIYSFGCERHRDVARFRRPQLPNSPRLPHNRSSRKRSSHRAAAPDGRTACGMVASICPTRN